MRPRLLPITPAHPCLIQQHVPTRACDIAGAGVNQGAVMTRRVWKTVVGAIVMVSVMSGASLAMAADEGAIRGAVLDQLGGAVANAQVSVVRDGQPVKTTTS